MLQKKDNMPLHKWIQRTVSVLLPIAFLTSVRTLVPLGS